MKTLLLKLMAALVMGAAYDVLAASRPRSRRWIRAQEPVPKPRAYGDNAPKVAIYVETNDANPLNAGDYLLSDGSGPLPVSWSSSPPNHPQARRSTEW